MELICLPAEIAARKDLTPAAKLVCAYRLSRPGSTRLELMAGLGLNERTVRRSVISLDKMSTKVDKMSTLLASRVDKMSTSGVDKMSTSSAEVDATQQPDKMSTSGVCINTLSVLTKRRKTHTPKADPATIDAIYQAYPRHVARPKAVEAITKALTKIKPDDLLAKVKAYAGNVEELIDVGQIESKRFVPHAATWFNQERWNDDLEESKRHPARVQAGGLAKEGLDDDGCPEDHFVYGRDPAPAPKTGCATG